MTMFAGQVSAGGVVSTTVTIAEHELDAPWVSVTVSTTVCAPSPKGPELSSVRVAIESPGSGSNEPLSTSAAAMVA
jgi:hypothetical protein